MRDDPDAAALLDAARETLLAEVAPTLAGRHRYVVLMVANAIGVASREMAAAGRSAETRAALLEDQGSAAALVAAIRAGARDADAALHRALTRANDVAAAISKPAGDA